jgi:hypothetical protein
MCCVCVSFLCVFCIKAPALPMLLLERIKDAFVFHPESAQRAEQTHTQERMKLCTHVIYKKYIIYAPLGSEE